MYNKYLVNTQALGVQCTYGMSTVYCISFKRYHYFIPFTFRTVQYTQQVELFIRMQDYHV